MSVPQHSGRFSSIFALFMIFCVLVWVWGLLFFMFWPWQKGGEWLPEYPIAVHCSNGKDCIVPVGELAQARSDGKLTALRPQAARGELDYRDLFVRWSPWGEGIEIKTSAWNFQTSVRYRIDSDSPLPVLVEYQELNAKIFFYAILAALGSLAVLHLYRRQRG